MMQIQSVHPDFLKLVDPQQPIEVISEGHQFTEGPVWDPRNQRLLFSDIPANTIFSWSEDKGVEKYYHPSKFANGLAIDHSGNLIMCEHQGRAISSLTKDMKRCVLADQFEGFKLNSPNDLVIAEDGSILFSDPIYGLREGNGGPAEQELPFQGVYRFDPHAGKLILITDSFERPNGLAISPDGVHLYVVDTVKQHIRKFWIEPDWDISGGDVWVELWDDSMVGRPDGIKFDKCGNLFSTGPGGIWVFSSDAVLLGRIFLASKTSNLAWGMSNMQTLFITSSDKVYRLKCLTGG